MAAPEAPGQRRPDEIRTGYLGLGIVGLGLLRTWLDPVGAATRTDELRFLLEVLHDDDLSPGRRPLPMGVVDGYSAWAPSYDTEFNPLIEVEQPVVWRWLADLPPGRALDVACGTGRHTAELVRLGFETTGIDATPAMLDRARQLVPSAALHLGDFAGLPFDEDSFDATVCALALTHTPDPSAAIAELARVTRPGGTVIISDIHPIATIAGGRAIFHTDNERDSPYVINNYQPLGELLRAFRSASLEVVDCDEPVFGPLVEKMAPPPLRDAFGTAMADLPFAIIWRLVRR